MQLAQQRKEAACIAPRIKWARELVVVDHKLTIVHTTSILSWLNIAALEKNGGSLLVP